MENIVTGVIDVLGQETHMQRLTLIPENNEDGQYGLYGNDELLMLLNYMVNGHWHPVFLTPTNTGYLDVLLRRDMLLTTPLKMEDQHICLVSILRYGQSGGS